jgi:hypothetical protein
MTAEVRTPLEKDTEEDVKLPVAAQAIFDKSSHAGHQGRLKAACTPQPGLDAI